MSESSIFGDQGPAPDPEFLFENARYLIGQIGETPRPLNAPGNRFLEARTLELSEGTAFVLRHRHQPEDGVDRQDEYFAIHGDPSHRWLAVVVDDLEDENRLVDEGDFENIAGLHDHNFAVAAGFTVKAEPSGAEYRMPDFLRLLHETVSLSKK